MPKSKRKKRRSKSKTGFFGVVKRLNGKYRAEIYIDRKTKNIGSSYETAEQAAKAVDREAIKLRRLVSSLNFPKKAPVGYTPVQKALPSNNTVGYRGVYKKAKKLVVKSHTLVHTKQQKMLPLPTTGLFSKPTNPNLS